MPKVTTSVTTPTPPSPLPRLSSPTVNCPDAPVLARFYADLTGGEVTFANEGWAVVDGPNGRIDFQTVSQFAAPTWPDGGAPVGIHLDFWVSASIPPDERASPGRSDLEPAAHATAGYGGSS